MYLKLSLRFSGEPSIWKLNCSLKSPRMELLKVTCMAWCPSGMTIPSDGLKEKRGPNRLLVGSRLKIASMSPLFASTTSYVCDEFTKMFPMSSLSNENCTLGPIPTPWIRSGSRDSLPVTSQKAVHVYCCASVGLKTTVTSALEFGQMSPSTGSNLKTSSLKTIASSYTN